jgi:hypothetical protein
VAYSAQFGHDAASFDDPLDCTNRIFAPQDGQSSTVGVAMRCLTLSTTSGFVRAWLKLIRGSMLRFLGLSPMLSNPKGIHFATIRHLLLYMMANSLLRRSVTSMAPG